MQYPALKLTFTDENTGITYTDSIHRIIETNFSSLNGECSMKIAIYANQAAAESGKMPIVLSNFSNQFYIKNFKAPEIVSVLGAKPTEAEITANLTVQQILGIRAHNFLKTLTIPFDYTAAELIFLTI